MYINKFHNMGLKARNPSWVFLTKPDPNQSPQLQRLARKLKCCCNKCRYDTFQKSYNQGADQTALVHRLVWAFVVRYPLAYSTFYKLYLQIVTRHTEAHLLCT